MNNNNRTFAKGNSLKQGEPVPRHSGNYNNQRQNIPYPQIPDNSKMHLNLPSNHNIINFNPGNPIHPTINMHQTPTLISGVPQNLQYRGQRTNNLARNYNKTNQMHAQNYHQVVDSYASNYYLFGSPYIAPSYFYTQSVDIYQPRSQMCAMPPRVPTLPNQPNAINTNEIILPMENTAKTIHHLQSQVQMQYNKVDKREKKPALLQDPKTLKKIEIDGDSDSLKKSTKETEAVKLEFTEKMCIASSSESTSNVNQVKADSDVTLTKNNNDNIKNENIMKDQITNKVEPIVSPKIEKCDTKIDEKDKDFKLVEQANDSNDKLSIKVETKENKIIDKENLLPKNESFETTSLQTESIESFKKESEVNDDGGARSKNLKECEENYIEINKESVETIDTNREDLSTKVTHEEDLKESEIQSCEIENDENQKNNLKIEIQDENTEKKSNLVEEDKSNLLIKGQKDESDQKSTKLIYDRQALMDLKFTTDSMKKPDKLPKLDIIHDTPNIDVEYDIQDSMYPKFGNKISMNNRSLGSRNSIQIVRNISNPDQKTQRKIISVSLNQQVKLRTTENAWKPAVYKKISTTSEEEATETLLKQARGILNKLTPQNFDKLLFQIRSLEINTEYKLTKLIELIFDKAVDEPAFCDQYALLCKNLSSIKATKALKSDQDIPSEVKFQSILLERCQKKFLGNQYEDINIPKRQEDIDNCSEKEQKQVLIDELDEDKRLARKKTLGNIKLIGALYKLNQLKVAIMAECINELLNNPDEDSIECLCTLLKSIGKKYDTESTVIHRYKRDFNVHMNNLQQMARNNKVTSRIKFLILDVLEMKDDNWKPRKLQVANKPKTIDEVHEDFKKEELSKMETYQINKRNDSMKKKDNWSLTGSKRSQQSSTNMLENLRKMKESNIGEKQLFGPSNVFSSWSSGSNAKSASQTSNVNSLMANKWITTGSSSSSSRDLSKQQNTFDNRMSSGGSSSLNKSSSLKSDQQSYHNSSNNFKDTRSKENKFTGFYMGDNDNKNMEYIKKCEIILSDYLSGDSIESCINSIYAASSEKCVYLFVQTAIDFACNKYFKKLKNIGELLSELVIVRNVIPVVEFNKGLNVHLDNVEDIIKDIPRFYENIGEILSHFFFKLSDVDRSSFYKETLKLCIATITSLNVIVYVIKNAIRSTSVKDVAERWFYSGMQFTDYSASKNDSEIKDFLIEDELKLFVDYYNNLILENPDIISEQICNRILGGNFDDIPAIMKENFNKNKSFDEKLISALTKACIYYSLNKDDKLMLEQLYSKCELLKEYVSDNTELQLEVLFASVYVNNVKQCPKDLLKDLFKVFFEENLVSLDTFQKWGNLKDCQRPGYGVGVKATKSFLNNLTKKLVLKD